MRGPGDRPSQRGSAGADVEEVVLYRSERTHVTRIAAPDGDGRAVRTRRLGPDGHRRSANEAAVLHQLTGLVGVPRLLSAGADPHVVVADVEGTSLAGVVAAAGGRLLAVWEPTELLDLMISLTTVVGRIHQRGVVHTDLNPTNILVHGPRRSPLVIDFEIARPITPDHCAFTGTDEIVGTLAYMAPEQTGRTGRPVDQRTDLYALGATFYQLVCGRPPFGTGDEGALALIHDHIARRPLPASALAAGLPPGLSNVIARLLEKEPDRRYQSAEGLAHDLYLIRERLRGDVGPADPSSAGAQEEPFRLGARDFPARLSAPSRLVARRAAVDALGAAFANSVAGRARGLLVAGRAGVGKTALLEELRPIVTSGGGWIVTGRCDQHSQDPRSDAVVQAIRALGRVLLGESESALQEHRRRLLGVLGDNAALVAALLPEFELLLGVAGQQAHGDPAQAQARVVQAARDILRATANARRPLVLVLDGLQWASGFTLDLIDAVLTGEDLPGLLLVGAHRDTELDATHPLRLKLLRWEQLGVAPVCVRLDNLSPADLATFLGEILRVGSADVAELAQVIGMHTGGNPYDTVELLNTLRQEGALVPAVTGWTWDTAAVRKHVGSAGVIDQLIARIDLLPASSPVVLEVMACLGGQVDLALLADACGLPPGDLLRQLAPCLDNGLLVSQDGGDLEGGAALRLPHDRLLRAVFERMGTAARQDLHLALARRLGRHPAHAVAAAEQYLSAADSVLDAGESRHAAGLFREAAAGLMVTNPAAAERFLAAATTLMTGVATDADEAGLLSLDLARHAALSSLGRFAEGDDLYRSIELRCPDTLTLVDAACVQIAGLTNRARPADALALGRALLPRLGCTVPSAAQLPGQIAEGLAALYAWLEQDASADDRRRPEATDPAVLAASKLIKGMMPPAFFSDQDMMAWLVLESRRLWADHGPSRALVAPLCHAAVVTIGARGDHHAGYEVVRRVLDESLVRGYEPETSHARFLFAVSAGHWFEPLENSLDHARRARDGLLAAGDSQTAVFTYHASIPTDLDTAATLDAHLVTVEAGLALAARTGNDQSVAAAQPYRQLARALRGQTRAPGSFADASFDENLYLAGLDANPMAAANFHITRAMAAAVFDDHPTLVRHARAAMPLLPYLQGHYAMARVHLLQSLALAQQLRTAAPAASADLLTQLDASRSWLARRAADSAGTFAHLVSLVDAERCWALGDTVAAHAGFDAAMQQVAGQQRAWHRAYITERAAMFALSEGMVHSGGLLIGLAHRAYLEWGATAKAAQLALAHPFLGAGDPPVAAQGSSGTGVSGHTLDLMSVLKASQALGGETDLHRLRVTVVDVLTAMTGATAVTVLLWNEDLSGWVLPASGDGAPVEVALDAAGAAIPLSAVRYAERTREPVLIADATRDDRFAADPYLAGKGSLSLLVVPILARGVPRVMLVLENHLHRGVFSSDRLDAVMLIAGQLAVSFDTAFARRRLEQEAERRLRLLDTLKAREQLLETLLAVQRSISHRAPLPQVLDAVTGGASAMLDGDFVALVLADPATGTGPRMPSVSGTWVGPRHDDLVLSVAAEAMAVDSLVTRTSQEHHDPSGAGAPVRRALTAAPVHVSGEIIGSLVTATCDDGSTLADRQDLLSAFAEQVSLALNDASTLEAMRAASYDSLTGLARRPLFLDRLERSMKDGREVSVLFIDLDRFKAVNDSLGHGAGDDLLAGVAGRVRGCIREDDMAARLGGDEFAVLLDDTHGPAAALKVAEALTTSLLQPFRIAGKEIFVTASVGVARSTGEQLTAGDLLRQADLAMYRAKRERSRRPVLFEPQMHHDATIRLDLEGDLERAVHAEQFWVQFQPQLLLDGTGVAGVEALVRWTHPLRGPISPATFIPIAEDTGVIIELGRWVLREACRQVAAWRRQLHPSLGLSVNVSGRQLRDGCLAADVASVLAETGLDAGALTLELTESVLMDDPEDSLLRLQELKQLGVLLALDDFGTGYSSLSYLHRFPVDELKIDKSFIDKIGVTDQDLAIVRAVVELARILKLRTIAEGIETTGQLDHLSAIGCEVGQGFLFARPLNGQDIPAFLARHRLPRQDHGLPRRGHAVPRQDRGQDAGATGSAPASASRQRERP